MARYQPYVYDPVGQGWDARIYARCRELGMGVTDLARLVGFKSPDSIKAKTSWNHYCARLRSTHKNKKSGTSYKYCTPMIIDGREERIKEIRNTSKCACCGIHENEMTQKARKDRLCLDHCHETGEPRALLCGACNMAEGLFKDSPEDLLKLYEYVTSRT